MRHLSETSYARTFLENFSLDDGMLGASIRNTFRRTTVISFNGHSLWRRSANESYDEDDDICDALITPLYLSTITRIRLDNVDAIPTNDRLRNANASTT